MERAKAVYINLLAAEQERRAVFEHGAQPLMPPDPPKHLTARLGALADISAGRFAEASDQLERAVENLPVQRGTINGQSFTADGQDVSFNVAGISGSFSLGSSFTTGSSNFTVHTTG